MICPDLVVAKISCVCVCVLSFHLSFFHGYFTLFLLGVLFLCTVEIVMDLVLCFFLLFPDYLNFHLNLAKLGGVSVHHVYCLLAVFFFFFFCFQHFLPKVVFH